MVGASFPFGLGRGLFITYVLGIILAALTVAASSANAATYYVDRNHSSASDSNPGTASAPWATIGKAANSVSAGDVVIVKSGTYSERVSVSRSGASGSRIEFRADPPRSVNMRGFHLLGNYLHVEGFVVENTTESGILIAGDHNSAANNAVLDLPAVGIRVQNDAAYADWPRDAHIYDNYIEHCNYGIVVGGFDMLVERNEIYRVTNEGIDGDADYFRFFGERITFRHNYAHGTTWQDISGADSVQGTSDDAHIDVWQSFINNKPSGTTFSDITLEGNVIRNCGQGAFWKALDTGASFTNVRIVNNVYLPGQGDERNTRAPLKVYDTDGVVVENNTFIGTIGTANVTDSSSGDSFFYNIFYKAEWAYSGSKSSTYTHGDNIIFDTGIPNDLDPSNDLQGVDPGLIDPTHIPANWDEAFAADAGWRVKPGTAYEAYGAQIDVTASSPTLASDDSFAGVQEDSSGNALDVLANDPGSSLTIVNVSTPDRSGSVSIVSGQSLSYSPAQDFFGSETFRYTVQDPDGAIDTARVTVSIANVNDPPTAANDTYSDIAGGSVSNTLNVLANDTSAPDSGETLRIVSVGSPSQGGTVTIQNGTTLSYTPVVGFSGTESFGYTVGDGNGGQDSATVTVTVQSTNNPPTAANDSFSGIREDSSSNVLDVLANDSTAPDTGETLAIVGLTAPSDGGTASVGSGGIVYTPATNFAGTETFSYRVSDGNGATDTATVSVTVDDVNDAPVARSDQFTIRKNTSGNILEVLANDGDVDGDLLSIIDLGVPSQGGTVGVAGGNALTYTPAANFAGTETFTYTIGDGRGGTDTATVSVQVENRNNPPSATSDSYTVDKNSTSNDLDVLSNDSDPDTNDSISIVSVGAPSAGGSVSINGGSSLVYTPKQNQTGTESFSYTIADESGATASALVTVSVEDLGPSTTDDTFKVPGNSKDNRMDVLKNDKSNGQGNGGGLLLKSAESTSRSVGGTLTIDGNHVLYTPPPDFTGTDTFTYTVEDDKGRTASGNVTVEVTDAIGLDFCVDYPAILVELTELRNDFDLIDEDLDADGITDDYMLEALQVIACYDSDTQLGSALHTAYKVNLLLFDDEANAAHLERYRESIAALMTVSSDMQTALAQWFEGLSLPLNQAYETVECDDTGLCMPQPLPDTPLEEGFQVFDESREPLSEPFSASADLDNDGHTNLEEFMNNVEAGGGSSEFAMAATDPALDGTRSAPRAESNSGNGGCFIATAAFGTPLAAEIDVLRDVRDRHLLTGAAGSVFVDTYYRLSPPIARVVADHPSVAAAIRTGLRPIVGASRLTLESPGDAAAGLLFALLMLAMLGHAVRKPLKS